MHVDLDSGGGEIDMTCYDRGKEVMRDRIIASKSRSDDGASRLRTLSVRPALSLSLSPSLSPRARPFGPGARLLRAGLGGVGNDQSARAEQRKGGGFEISNGPCRGITVSSARSRLRVQFKSHGGLGMTFFVPASSSLSLSLWPPSQDAGVARPV